MVVVVVVDVVVVIGSGSGIGSKGSHSEMPPVLSVSYSNIV